jgi:hypothetical protein
MCYRALGCVPGNLCLTLGLILGFVPWCRAPRSVLVYPGLGTGRFLVKYQDVMMCDLLLLSRDGP